MRKTVVLQVLFAVLCLALGAAVVYKLNLWNIRGVEPNEVYLRYKDTPGIHAAFIKDKQVSDTLRMDMTLLEATDSTGWNLLKKDFDIKELPPEFMQLAKKSGTLISIRLFPKGRPGEVMDTVFLNNDIAAISRIEHTICIFHMENEQQHDEIVNKQVKDLKILTQ